MARSVSGCARVVSSVTYITRRPSRTANVIASSVLRSSQSSVQPSAYWRIGELPMKQQHSIGSAGALLDLGHRRGCRRRGCGAAQLAATLQPLVADLAGQALGVAGHVGAGAGQADVGRMDAERVDEMQDAELVVNRRAYRTDGDCRPSRRVSSSSITGPGRGDAS